MLATTIIIEARQIGILVIHWLKPCAQWLQHQSLLLRKKSSRSRGVQEITVDTTKNYY